MFMETRAQLRDSAHNWVVLDVLGAEKTLASCRTSRLSVYTKRLTFIRVRYHLKKATALSSLANLNTVSAVGNFNSSNQQALKKRGGFIFVRVSWIPLLAAFAQKKIVEFVSSTSIYKGDVYHLILPGDFLLGYLHRGLFIRRPLPGDVYQETSIGGYLLGDLHRGMFIRRPPPGDVY